MIMRMAEVKAQTKPETTEGKWAKSVCTMKVTRFGKRRDQTERWQDIVTNSYGINSN